LFFIASNGRIILSKIQHNCSLFDQKSLLLQGFVSKVRTLHLTRLKQQQENYEENTDSGSGPDDCRPAIFGKSRAQRRYARQGSEAAKTLLSAE
jgi:hypothetical protein